MPILSFPIAQGRTAEVYTWDDGHILKLYQFHQLSIPGLHSYRDGLANSIRQAPHLPAVLREKTLASLSALPAETNLCHGDFHPGNVLITSHGAVVIDWMTASLGSPWIDVARTSLILTIGVKAAGKQLSPLIRLGSGLFHREYLRAYLRAYKHRHRALALGGQTELARGLPIVAAARLNEQIEPERAALLEIVKTKYA